jgi:hypothetical protein
MCLGTNSSDAEEVEKFLRSKVHPDEAKKVNQMTRRGKVVGWAGLFLDDAAREEVARYPGISNLRKTLITHPDRVLASKSWLQPGPVTPRALERKPMLISRSEKWQKQVDADDALVLDSQYP